MMLFNLNKGNCGRKSTGRSEEKTFMLYDWTLRLTRIPQLENCREISTAACQRFCWKDFKFKLYKLEYHQNGATSIIFPSFDAGASGQLKACQCQCKIVLKFCLKQW